MTDAAFPDEHLWERFLDTHPMPTVEEELFLDYLTGPDIHVPATLEGLEEAYQHFRQSHPGLS